MKAKKILSFILIVGTILTVSVLLSSCGGAHWSHNVRKPGVGKVKTQVYAWGNSGNCATYPTRSYTSNYSYKKQFFYRKKKRN